MGRKPRKELQGMDAGSSMMARHFTIVPKLSSLTETSMKVLDGDEVDKLLLHDVVTPAQHGTLITLAKRLQGYGFAGIKSPDYSSPPQHLDPEIISDKKALAIRNAVALISRMDKHPAIGAHRRKKLIHLVLDNGPWGKLRHQTEELHYCIAGLDDIFLNRR